MPEKRRLRQLFDYFTPPHWRCDRDTKTPRISGNPVNDGGTNVIRLPPLSLNLNAYAERFLRSKTNVAWIG
jgi:hypothetical protein